MGGGAPPVQSPSWTARPQPPLSKLSPWVTMRNSWEEGSEPEKLEEAMRRGHNSPSSKPPPPKTLTPYPSRLSNTGTDSHLSEQERDMAPICKNSSSSLENKETRGGSSGGQLLTSLTALFDRHLGQQGHNLLSQSYPLG